MANKGPGVAGDQDIPFALENYNNVALVPAVGANTIAHGMSATPTVVLISILDATSSQIISAISLTATTINFTAATVDPLNVFAF